MKKYSVQTADGRYYRINTREQYEKMLDTYTKLGHLRIDGDLLERHHKITFAITGNDERFELPTYTLEVKKSEEECIWNSAVLQDSAARLKEHKKPLTFAHYKAARQIAGTWNFEHTLQVLETDFAAVDAEGPQIEREIHSGRSVNHQGGCGHCNYGWIINHPKRSVRPCGCNPGVNEVYAEYQKTTRS